MDIKVEIKEEEPYSDDTASQNEIEFFTKNVTTKDAVLLDYDWEMPVKRETESETLFSGLCLQKERKCFTRHPIKCETLTCSNNCYNKTENEEETLVSHFSSQKEREFLPTRNLVMKAKDYEIHNKIKIREPWSWLETESSPVYEDIKDGDSIPVQSSRLSLAVVSGDSRHKSALPFAESSGKDTHFCNEKDHPEFASQESDITKVPTVEKHVQLEQSGKCSEGKKTYSKSGYWKKGSLSHEDKKSHSCEICGKKFTSFMGLKRHNTIFHEGVKKHKCEICEKSFTWLTHLKRHNLIHEAKAHKCGICEKSFSNLPKLNIHILIHESIKPYKCDICEKSFGHLYLLTNHEMVHKGIKPYKCNICGKTFMLKSYLNRHIHKCHKGTKV